MSNRLAGQHAPIVSFFHFHRHANGRIQLVDVLRRTSVCKTNMCSFLEAESVVTRTADDVLGEVIVHASTADM